MVTPSGGAMLLLDTYPSHVYSYLKKNYGIVSLQTMKTILPIGFALILALAPALPLLNNALEGDKNAEEIPFHTPVHSSGFFIPQTIDTTLTIGPEQGIVILQGNIIVEPSGHLIILPGTTIFAHEYSNVRVFGMLDAQGEKNEPIAFISNEQNEQNRNWGGILYEHNTKGFISHTTFHHASPAVSCQEAGGVVLQDNTYRFGNIDIYGPCAVQEPTKSVQ